jgi:hypothetical protein
MTFLLVAAASAALLLYGFARGRIISSWGWAERAQQPGLYWFAISGPLVALVASLLALTYF